MRNPALAHIMIGLMEAFGRDAVRAEIQREEEGEGAGCSEGAERQTAPQRPRRKQRTLPANVIASPSSR